MVSFLGLCRLLDDHNYADVARILNENGFKGGDGLKLTSPAVGYDRTAYGLRSRFDQLRARGRLTMLEISKRYGVSTNTISDWRRKGRIPAHAIDDRNQFLFEDPGPNPPRKHARKVLRSHCMRTAELLVTVGLTIASIGAAAQDSESVALAFERLQSESPTEIKQGSEQLVRLEKSDPKAREYIALHLPPLIDKGPKDYLGRWITLVRLAGELKIAEAAPALAKWLTIDNIGEISTAGFMKLENNPAGAPSCR
jgi:hypothetical protein